MAHIRRLAAIMFTDIEGYTAIMQRSESEAIKTRERHRQVFNSLTEEYQGTIVQYYGDGTLSIFNSAISAVECACKLQEQFLKDPKIPVRIGIHIGDIIVTEDDIIGDSVNLASRIESAGIAGSVLISDKVLEEIKNQEELKVKYLGEFQFKNDRQKRDIFAIDLPGLVIPEQNQLEATLINGPRTKVKHLTPAPKSDKKDVFISYAQLDNESITHEEAGWISVFDQALRKRVAQILGYQPGIWREPQESLDEQALNEFIKLKVLISILSPRYLESKNCLKQLKEFCTVAEHKGGVKVNNKWRIFKVIKTPVPAEMHPPEIEGILGYEFFEVTPDGHFREFSLDKKSPNYYQYLERFEDVAQDLSQVIRLLTMDIPVGEKPAEIPGETKEGNSVYLAKTTSDLNPLRDNIRRDLEMRGYRVLPDKELPLDQRFSEAVKEQLARSQLSVLLLGGKYGLVPEDEEHSVPMLQYRLAREAGLPCLIWQPEDMKIDDTRQKAFLDQVLMDPPNHELTEFMSDDFEDFKTHLIDTLRSLTPPQEYAGVEEKRPPRVYLIYNQADSEAAKIVDDHLYNLGFEVLKPLFEGTETELREMHQDNLRICDAALIYYDYGSEFWLNAKINDLRKALGFGRTSPITMKAVYVSGEKNPSKEGFRSRELVVIKQFENFSENSLSPFTDKLKQSS
ncbi:MAG: hypothetical protein DHS20C17_23260 [Cyclobacteriaceae bacterium]|nr:MAG: hypothetical protein DHS20C17_23260 [Cyclobacteriaceae bacterium]